MKPVILIFGPTASGKTTLSLHLAHKFGGEIISADSMQIYRNMDIGTAKASPAERAEIPHHMIDICDVSEHYSAAQYRQDALRKIREIHARGKLPFVVGGTGLYFDALLHEPNYGETKTNPKIRAKLQEELALRGCYDMHAKLADIDPISAERIHPNDEKRIIRALEIYTSTNKRPSELLERKPNTEFSFLSFYLKHESRSDLYDACNRRVIEMIDDGLVDEVAKLFQCGLKETPTASQAIGYKEFIDYHAGNATLSDTILLIQQRTRNYAKRQITWFSKMNAIHLPAGNHECFDLAEKYTADFLKGASC